PWPRGGRSDVRHWQLAGGRAERGAGGRRDFRRLDGRRRTTGRSGETKNTRPDLLAAAGNVDLPRTRAGDDRGGGKGEQSIFCVGGQPQPGAAGSKGARVCPKTKRSSHA